MTVLWEVLAKSIPSERAFKFTLGRNSPYPIHIHIAVRLSREGTVRSSSRDNPDPAVIRSSGRDLWCSGRLPVLRGLKESARPFCAPMTDLPCIPCTKSAFPGRRRGTYRAYRAPKVHFPEDAGGLTVHTVHQKCISRKTPGDLPCIPCTKSAFPGRHRGT
jgi:hypothetical protein